MPIRQHLQETSFRITSSDVPPEIALASQPACAYFDVHRLANPEKVTVVWSNGDLHEVDIEGADPGDRNAFLSLHDPVFGRLHVRNWSLRSAYLHDGTSGPGENSG